MRNVFRPCRALGLALLFMAAVPPASAQEHSPDHDAHKPSAPAPAAGGRETRQAVRLPARLREDTLRNMRDHLLAISEIQEHLSKLHFDQAAEIAEKRLGMSSLTAHGAHEVAKHMPRGMQDAGSAMHHSASRFALAVQEAAIDRDLARALAALNQVTQSCVACHARYRLK
ncbi:MAG: DUF3156 family protein [Betaproteobacteria bacterium]|nr:DUF3156 family protein [Betaproteobacteria bacterium]